MPGDSNGVADVFAKRLGSGAIARVATAATAAGPGRWNFSGTWPTYDTVALPGAAAGSWFRSSLWNPAGTSVLYPSAGGQLLVVDAPRKQDQPVRQLTTPSIAGVTAADHAVALSWRQPQSPARITGYRIQARVGAGAWRTVVPNTGSTGTRRTITGLANGAAYRLRVAALSGARQGSWSIASPRVVPFGEPGRPGHLEASDVTKRRVTLAWDAASANGARVAYQLQKRRHGAWRTLDTTAKPHWRGKLGKPGADVVVRVLAANRAGHGPASSTITVHLRGR